MTADLAVCRVFQPTKNAFVDTLQSILDDVKWSLLFLVLTMWGFAGAFYILFREDQAEFEVSNRPLVSNRVPLTSVCTTTNNFVVDYACCIWRLACLVLWAWLHRVRTMQASASH